MLNKMHGQSFDWLSWRANSIHSLGIQCRHSSITSVVGASILRKYGVGYCLSESLVCRPKLGEVALMCFKDGECFWFHLRKNEFDEVFKGFV